MQVAVPYLGEFLHRILVTVFMLLPLPAPAAVPRLAWHLRYADTFRREGDAMRQSDFVGDTPHMPYLPLPIGCEAS
jgi:hypothetical protein